MTNIPDLIKRLEQCTGPDRELANAVLIAAYGWVDAGSTMYPGHYLRDPGGTVRAGFQSPDPLESIETALELLEPDRFYLFSKGRCTPGEPLYGIRLYPIGDTGDAEPEFEAEHDMAGACITIAALKARLP